MDDSRSITRRGFVAASGTTLAALAIAGSAEAQQGKLPVPKPAPAPALLRLTAAEARELEAVCSRILPSEPGSPGARELGIVTFVDRTLAVRFKETLPDLRTGLAELQRVVGERHPGAQRFSALTDAEQDAMLADFEKVDPSKGTSEEERARLAARATIFGLARYATVSGAFSHPKHGGNRNRGGWKLMGFVDRHSWTPPFGELG